jgi:hypothetical protein
MASNDLIADRKMLAELVREAREMAVALRDGTVR